jgi:hypothetical protein
MSPSEYKDQMQALLREGSHVVLGDYMEQLMAEGVSLDEKRKFLELSFRTLGIENKEKVENLPLVQITFVNNRLTVQSVDAGVIELDVINMEPSAAHLAQLGINVDLAGL